MQSYWKRLFAGFTLALGLYILYLIWADSRSQIEGRDGMLTALGQFDGRLLPLLIGTQLLVVLCRFIEWQYYMRVVGAAERLSLKDSAIIFITCFMMVVSPGKAGELLKAIFVQTRTGISAARVAPAVLAERIVDGLAAMLLMVGALLLAGDSLKLVSVNGTDYNAVARGLVFFSTLAITAGLIIVQIRALAEFFLRVLEKLPVVRRLAPPARTFYESSREIFQPRHILRVIWPGIGVFLSSTLCFVFVLAGFGVPITWEVFLQAAFMVGVTSAVGALSFIPNGAGITEATNTLLILALIGPQYPLMNNEAVAAAASLIQGFFHKWFRVLLGIGVALVYRNRLFSAEVETAMAEAKAAHAA